VIARRGRERDSGVFKEPLQFEDGVSAAAGPAVLVRAQIVDELERALPQGPGEESGRWRRLRDRVEDWCERVDLAPDLAVEIGSRRWLRGLSTMLGLSAAALAFWPDFAPVEAAPLPSDSAARDEYRSQMIMPLGLGGDSGRRMGATASVRALTGAPERPRLQLVATLGQGDTLARMLARAGVGEADSERVAALVGSALPAGEIAPGTRFDITLGRRPEPGAARALESIGFRARFDLDLTVSREGGSLALIRRLIAVDATPLRVRGEVGSSLYRSARNAGAPISAIQAYLQAIDRHVSLESDLAPGDAFDIVVGYKRSAGGERQVGELLYAGIERGGKPRLQLLRWGQDGAMVSAGGLGQSESRAIGAPVAGRITSTFGMRRHPILGFVRRHAGVDYGAHYGSPIYAVADGLVSFAGRHGGHGNFVRLDHGGGNGTGYGHMSRIAVHSGARVQAGQVIGYVGSTGLSTGPHLHFEAYQNGRPINPMGLRFVARPQIDGRELSAFKQRLANVLAIRPGAALGSIAPAAPAAQQASGREIDRVARRRESVPALPDRSAARSLAVAEGLANHN
jgi:murein DD-endopeptidase MepM/ murein hydrolase activator NlpD